MPNPHKVRPIVATGIPAGSTYTRPIIVYNPRDGPALSVTEVSEQMKYELSKQSPFVR